MNPFTERVGGAIVTYTHDGECWEYEMVNKQLVDGLSVGERGFTELAEARNVVHDILRRSMEHGSD